MIPADELRAGMRVEYNYLGDWIPIEVLRDRETRPDFFGRPMSNWWCRRLDTDSEGYITFGPQLEALPLRTPPP